jgi:hypothetical protein
MHIDTPLANLPASLAREAFAELCASLPPRRDETAEARAARDELAMAAVAALHPADAFEARLAVRIVAMDAHAADALRSAGLAVNDPAELRRCRAQAASMARNSDSALRELNRMQARREKLEAEMNPAAMERAGYWFRDCSVPAPESPPPDEAEPQRTEAVIDAEAAKYEVMYPARAARIRAAGGLPAKLDFGPPEPDIVAALLRRQHPAVPR